MDAYHIMPHFWKCVLTFGTKSEENEFEFPSFRSRMCVDSKNEIVTGKFHVHLDDQ